ncbi:glycine receptor subunit alpha-4 [Lingula anatina]|uniref:Gamma-aminobutyric acid receptor subunit beta n=1 Tax=Lingula anatina TaxID=7574 RepID=A0A1S3JVQ1_LINAN|nr:glycine receptor subunit alpha-4 [Lingula anatina]|eukprot:XP_013414136.1 glycine receptor subunit alpha-4 [Lingula anatina]
MRRDSPARRLQSKVFCHRQTNAVGIGTEYEERIAFLDHLLQLQYDKRIRPHFRQGKPTVVKVDVLFSAITDVDDASMDFTVNFFLRQRWDEPRLAFNSTSTSMMTLSEVLKQYIWVPDLYFANEKTSFFHIITTPNVMIRISPQGQILYSQRLSATLNCEFHLLRFPMDDQTCRIQMESYAHSTDDLIFEWLNIEFNSNIDETLPEFEVTNITSGDCTAVYSTGAFTCLYLDIHLSRDLGFYLLSVYLPSTVTVVLAFVNFLIDATAVPARTTVGIVTILSLTTQSVTVQDRLPKVSYIKAIDVWLAACLVFVVGSMLEYAVVNVLLQKDAREKKIALEPRQTLQEKQNANWQTLVNKMNIESRPESSSSTTSLKDWNTCTNWLSAVRCGKHKSKLYVAEKIDYYSRYVFTGGFLIFNLIYWVVYFELF